MTVQFLQHSQIDKARWLQAIRQSNNGLIYAWPQYLDAISPGWQALIADDYSLLMPLTYRKKWSIRYLYQPAFCQQLGIFGNGMNEAVTQKFLDKAASLFSFAEISLNHQNTAKNASPKKNYVLALADDYETIRGRYGKDLIKKNLQRTEKFQLQYRPSTDFHAAIDIFENLYSQKMSGNRPADYHLLKSAVAYLSSTDNAFVREVKMPNGELLACGIFLKDERRIYNIASSTLPNGRTLEANHFLFDQLIREFAGSGLLLDFEGSEVPGIERFYKKYGSHLQPYYNTRWNRLPWPLRLLKK